MNELIVKVIGCLVVSVLIVYVIWPMVRALGGLAFDALDLAVEFIFQLRVALGNTPAPYREIGVGPLEPEDFPHYDVAVWQPKAGEK